MKGGVGRKGVPLHTVRENNLMGENARKLKFSLSKK